MNATESRQFLKFLQCVWFLLYTKPSAVSPNDVDPTHSIAAPALLVAAGLESGGAVSPNIYEFPHFIRHGHEPGSGGRGDFNPLMPQLSVLQIFRN